MATATKSKKSASKSSKPAAKSSKSSAAARTAVVEQHMTRNEIGRLIQEVMSKAPMTLAQIAEKCGHGVTERRVAEHVAYEQSKNRCRTNGKRQIIVTAQPIRRG